MTLKQSTGGKQSTSSKRSRQQTPCSSVMMLTLFSIGLFALFSVYVMIIHHHDGESPSETSRTVTVALPAQVSTTTENSIATKLDTSSIAITATDTPVSDGMSTIDRVSTAVNSIHHPSGGSDTAVAVQELHSSSKTRRLHAVTYASHGGRDDRFCRAVESAIRHDIDLIVLGWGVKWVGLSQKLEAAHSFAAALPEEDIILFTDAFDVMFTNTADHILEEFSKENTDIIFAGECGCWPHVIIDKGKACFEGYPKAPTPYRYLNSGTWIGKARTAETMLAAVIEEAGKDFANANDQKLVADMFMQGRFGIKLDYYARLFQSMHMTHDRPLPFCDPMTDIEVVADGRFHNKRTDSLPSVFHFNGGGKRHHLNMESQLWYKKNPKFNTREALRAVADTEISVPVASDENRKMKFRDMCAPYFKGRA